MPHVAVTLRLPAEAGASSVAVAGDFNDWRLDADIMRPTDDGGFALTLSLAVGARHRYRYWVDGDRWENDWNADDYQPNDYNGDDAIVDLTDGSPRRLAASATATATSTPTVDPAAPPVAEPELELEPEPEPERDGTPTTPLQSARVTLEAIRRRMFPRSRS